MGFPGSATTLCTLFSSRSSGIQESQLYEYSSLYLSQVYITVYALSGGGGIDRGVLKHSQC